MAIVEATGEVTSRSCGDASGRSGDGERQRVARTAERLVLRALDRLHREQPLAAGFRTDALVARVLADAAAPRPPSSHRGGTNVQLDAAAVHEIVTELAARGEVERTGRRVSLPGRRPTLDPETRRRADRLLDTLRASGMGPPPVRALARDTGVSEAVVEHLRASGELIAVAADLDYPADTLRGAQVAFATLASTEGEVRAARFRDVIGAGRRHAVALLEYFDGIGLSRREGQAHRLIGALADEPPTDSPSAAGRRGLEHDT